MTTSTAKRRHVESDRLAALDAHAILDTPAERSFDDLAELAASICQVPVSAVTFVARDRQWHKAKVGIEIAGLPREVGFCSHTIGQDDLLEIGDLRADPRFAENPLVVGAPGARFYAGATLHSDAGYKLGALCVLDTVPRELTDEQRRALRVLARQAEVLLELRLRVHELERAQATKAQVLDYLVHDLKTPR
ncbi:MAG: GAF domain-containing protein [Kofleriaceae bacterium]